MDCPKCGSEKHTKNGIIKGRQRYKCKQCRYNYTVIQKTNKITEATQKLVLKAYLEGIGFRGIGRIFGISRTSALSIVKNYGRSIEMPAEEEPVVAAELDEMHTYVNRKKTTDGFGLRSTD